MKNLKIKPSDLNNINPRYLGFGDIFSVSPWEYVRITEAFREHVADIVNERIKELLDKAPTVYHDSGDPWQTGELQCWGVTRSTFDTHEAKLVMVRKVRRAKKKS